MKHRDAIDSLPDYGTGALDPGTEAELAAHVERCSSCADWLETRKLLAEGLFRGWDRGAKHPDSDLLALCVVRPEEVHELDRTELHEHLEACSLCRGDLRLVREAVREARPAVTRRPGRHLMDSSRISRPMGLMAASLVVLLLGSGVFGLVGFLVDGIPAADDRREGAPETASRPDVLPERMEEISGRDLDGSRTIDSDRALLVSKLAIKTDADVTFQSGGVVAVGVGFRVDAGARMRVGSRHDPERTFHKPPTLEPTDRSRGREWLR